MTIIACPHGCGGYLDTGKDDYCPSCRRSPAETEVILLESFSEPYKMFNPVRGSWYYITDDSNAAGARACDSKHSPGMAGYYEVDCDPPVQSPVTRKLSWCWAWHGPAHHRMRCYLPKGHEGEHHHHETRDEGVISVACDGEVIAPKSETSGRPRDPR